MNEEAWTKSDSTATDFITIRPIPALKSQHKTSVRLVYDDFALYFFVTCYSNIQRLTYYKNELYIYIYNNIWARVLLLL